MSSSESHTVQAVAVAVAVSVTGLTVGGLMLCFTISVLNPVFLHAVCQKPKPTNNNKKNTSYGIEGNSPCCQGKPFSLPFEHYEVCSCQFVHYVTISEDEKRPLEAAEYPLRPLEWEFKEMTCSVTCR